MTIEELIIAGSEERNLPEDFILECIDYYEEKCFSEEFNQENLIGLGISLYLKGDHNRCSRTLNTALKGSSTSPLLFMVYGLNYHKEKALLLAEESFLKVTNSHCSAELKEWAQLKYTEILIEKSEYIQSIDYIKAVLPHCSSLISAKLQCHLAFVYHKSQLIEEAIPVYKNLGKSKCPFSKASASVAYLIDKKYPKALESLTQLPDSLKENTNGWLDSKFLMALYHFNTKNYQESSKILLTLLVPCKNYDIYCSALAVNCSRLKNNYEAFNFMLKSLSANSKKCENWYNLAVLYKKTGQNDSEEAFRKAKELDFSQILPTTINRSSELIFPMINIIGITSESLVEIQPTKDVVLPKKRLEKFSDHEENVFKSPKLTFNKKQVKKEVKREIIKTEEIEEADEVEKVEKVVKIEKIEKVEKKQADSELPPNVNKVMLEFMCTYNYFMNCINIKPEDTPKENSPTRKKSRS